MSKYENNCTGIEYLELQSILTSGEEIIWQGKPKKSAYIINKVITLSPVALIWFVIDFGILSTMLSSFDGDMLFFIIPFFALHLFPFWIWLGNTLTAGKSWANTRYAVTNKRIIIETGIVGMNYQTIYYKDITNVNLKVGVIDKLLGVGDIYFQLKAGGVQSFLDLKDAYQIYPKIQKVVLDIQTDIEFPNNLRPDSNDGYNTKYNSNF